MTGYFSAARRVGWISDFAALVADVYHPTMDVSIHHIRYIEGINEIGYPVSIRTGRIDGPDRVAVSGPLAAFREGFPLKMPILLSPRDEMRFDPPTGWWILYGTKYEEAK